MNNLQFKYKFRFLTLIIAIGMLSIGFMGDDKKSNKPQTGNLQKSNATQVSGKVGDAYRLNINNINFPLNRTGVLASVNITDPNPAISGAGGKFAGHVFLFSGGFFLSGTANGKLFSNAVASASLVQDYTTGMIGGESDSRSQLYVLKASDPHFGSSWQDWKDAVDLGADYYDGNGDGIYNPTDNNGNGTWDADEDRPDLIGDEMVWSVYNDGLRAAQRRWNTVDPLGIEIRQSVFAFASSGAIGNLIFVRYRIKYVGLGNVNEPNALEDVYFGAWADPDLGFADDDLVGIDVPRNAGYTYQKKADEQYGNQPPSFMIDFFSGPQEYITGETYVDINGDGEYTDGVDTPLDSAFSSRGQILGKKSIPGAKNLPVSSFVQYINGDPFISDPSNATEARNYLLGLDKAGGSINPCNWAYGTVSGGVDCNSVDPRFWYSGDPVTNVGWIATLEKDIRQMTNTGPFKLRKGEEKEIVVAIVVGQGTSPLNSVTVARAVDDGAQIIFDNNFLAPSAPPAPVVETESTEDYIDLKWNTKEQFEYKNKVKAWDLKLGGYNVYAFKVFNSSETINNQENKKLIGRFQKIDFINNLYAQDGNTGGIELLYEAAPAENKLDSVIYGTDEGRIRFRITKDPFTGGDLIKGKPYYFVVTSYAVNHQDSTILVNKSGGNFGNFGDYYLSSQTFVQAVENPTSLNMMKEVVFGEDLYAPQLPMFNAQNSTGKSSGILNIDQINSEELTGDQYSIKFKIDSTSALYSVLWSLKNETKNDVLVENGDYYLYGSTDILSQSFEGFIPKLSPETPASISDQTVRFLGTIAGTTDRPWYTANFYYLATDLRESGKLPGGGSGIQNLSNKFTKADKLRRVVIDFSKPGKAYRYLNGFVGTNLPTRRNSYMYAGGVVVGNPSIPDPSILNEIGQLGVGFIDVPFTVFVEDNKNGVNEARQLAVGILERKISEGGSPDGIWDPGTDVNKSGEYIFIFDQDYDPNGNQLVYTGNLPAATSVWADLKGYTIPTDANATQLQRTMAKSPFFDVLYAVGLQRKNNDEFYSAKDKFTISVNRYPYSPIDEFKFQTKKGGVPTEEEMRAIFDKVNVFPNPLFGYNSYTGYKNLAADDPFVTFTNLPNEQITIKIYSLAGQLLRTLEKDPSISSPFLDWDLKNDSGLRVASGLYIAIVSSSKFGDKILKFSIIMPQKQLPRF